MKRVVIAEKASVARSLASALGGYRKEGGHFVKGQTYITWAVGHLVEQLMPHEYDQSLKRWSFDTLPFVPSTLRTKVIENRRDRFAAVASVMRDADLVVNACDAGREGELIFRRIAEQLNYRGAIRRLWISSYTDEAIRAGFGSLKPGEEYEDLFAAARVRSDGDWIMGLNGTRALTVRHGGGTLLTVGRVQTPVLAGIVQRELAIRDFVPEPFWLVEASFELDKNQESYKGIWFRPKEFVEEEPQAKTKSKKKNAGPSRASWLKTLEEAEAIAQRVAGQPGIIDTAHTKQRRENPPQLFDLTALQRLAHARYRMTAKKTLSVAQGLYEKHKLITYPRTDSRYISKDLVPSLEKRLEALTNTDLEVHARELLGKSLSPNGRMVNDKKVTDHHALMPTPVNPRSKNLSSDEWKIYELIGRQLIAALFPPAVWLDTKVITLIETSEFSDYFLTKGKILSKAGWRAVIPPRGKDKPLPNMSKGDMVAVADVEVKEDQTRPPPRFSEGTLLKFMETAGKDIEEEELREAMKDHGLGTPATRADIIEKLKYQRYMEEDGKILRPTALGEMLIALIPIEEIKSPQMTGQWEQRIRQIQRGEYAAPTFREEIVSLTDRLIQALKCAKSRSSEVNSVAPPPSGGRGGSRYSKHKGKQKSWSKPSKVGASKVKSVGGRFDKKSQKKGVAKKGAKKPTRGKKREVGLELGNCPRCAKGAVIVGRTDFGCNRWREGCRFLLRRGAPLGRSLTDTQVKDLLKKGHTRPLTFKREGNEFKGRFYLKGESLVVEKSA